MDDCKPEYRRDDVEKATWTNQTPKGPIYNNHILWDYHARNQYLVLGDNLTSMYCDFAGKGPGKASSKTTNAKVCGQRRRGRQRPSREFPKCLRTPAGGEEASPQNRGTNLGCL